jgi:hypothetical protein
MSEGLEVTQLRADLKRISDEVRELRAALSKAHETEAELRAQVEAIGLPDDDALMQMASEIGDPCKNGTGFWFEMEQWEELVSALRAKIKESKPQSRRWPASRDVGRYGDMSSSAHLRVGLDSDNDVYVSVYDEEGGASVEFCTLNGGGGKSRRTREALIKLMLAMEADNTECPSFDWWKRCGGSGEGEIE